MMIRVLKQVPRTAGVYSTESLGSSVLPAPHDHHSAPVPTLQFPRKSNTQITLSHRVDYNPTIAQVQFFAGMLPLIRILLLGLSVVLWGRDPLEAETVSPRVLDEPEVIEARKLVRSYAELGLSAEFVVDGERLFDGPVLLAERIVFRPGGKLVLTPGQGGNTARYIAAHTVVAPAGESAQVIWAPSRSLLPSSPPMSVKAASGMLGPSEGDPGGRGAPGERGNPGFPGSSAPTIYFFVESVEGGSIVVNLRGQNGGAGGPGQDGGDGGPGRGGRQSLSSFFECRSGGGNGGSGGDGGKGGDGGVGGSGGNGGTFVLIAPQLNLDNVGKTFVVDVAPGIGGPGGPPGQPGGPGESGGGGGGAGFCAGGAPGARGQGGSPGQPGPDGREGSSGAYAVVGLTEHQFRLTLGPP
jgi:hypothetical protein